MSDLTLIISFYNRIDYLKLVFAGLEIQTFKNFEVIIADDGSDENVIKELNYLNISGKKIKVSGKIEFLTGR
jgi:glycosyltransferase involved in cell wall biosynthesis